MKKWEDTIKERLEGYESTLPEGSYADFQRLRADAKGSRKKVYPLAWAAAVAVAASLAAVLFLRQPKQADGGVKLVQHPVGGVQLQQPPVEVLPVADSLAVEEPVVVAPLMAQAASVKPAMSAMPGKPAAKPIVESEPEAIPQEEPKAAPEAAASPETPDPEDDKETSVTAWGEPFIPTGSPFIPDKQPARKVNLKLAIPVAGGLLGTGALALLAVNLVPMAVRDAAEVGDSMTSNPGSAPNNPDLGQQVNPPVCEDWLLDTRHFFPLRLGASARIPVWKNLYVTSGLEYSSYTSRFTYSYVGEKTQVAQYLGIPLRLDWVFPLGKRFDAYAGAGMQADFCLSARWGSEEIEGDRPVFSLGAAGGVQLNLIRNLGLFVEPQLTWRIPTGGTVLLQTYRTRHPWMFSVSAGVRINLEKDSVK